MGTSRVVVDINELLEGRYRILKLLAEGGMGSVFLAEHLLIKRRVAIKILHPELATDSHVVDCFLNEARAAGMLGHPNIVESTDMGFTKDHVPYIVFEYLEGSLLTDEIYRVHGMPMRRAIRIAEQIAGAMHVAHEAGIVHRDLKSDNIFLTDKDDASDHVKVLDFGIARVMDGNDQRRTMVVGTPEFMAPEQMTHPEAVDRRADIYALGVILYEMLTARRPFTGADLQRQILTTAPASLGRPEIPAALSELILERMLAKDPAQRPQTMSEVVAALDAYMTREDGSVMVRRRSVPTGSVKPADVLHDTSPFAHPMGMLNTPIPSTAPMPRLSARPTALYTVVGLSLVVGALGVTLGFKSSSKPVEKPAAVSLPVAAIPAPAPPKPTEPSKIAISIDSDVPNAHVVFRRHVSVAPIAMELAPNPIVELVEISALGYKTERYWLTLDRATHLKAHLEKGIGLDEASEEATLTALGEIPVPVVAAAAAPVVVVSKTVERPMTSARLAPRKIGRTAETPVAPPPPVAIAEEPVVVAEVAPAPEPVPVVEAPAPEVAKPVVVAPAPPVIAGPHNISPAAFKAMRTSGNEDIAAPITVAKQMVRDGKVKVTAVVKACMSPAGEVIAASMIKSSGYGEYDKVLVEGVRGWHFKSGEAVCSAVTFAYKP